MKSISSFDSKGVDNVDINTRSQNMAIDTLKELLTSKGFYEAISDLFSNKFNFDDEFLDAAKRLLSTVKIDKICEVIKDPNLKTAADAYKAIKDAGCLKLEPQIVMLNDADNPSLVLGWNRYLHWFRGYYFQISENHTGQVSVYSGADRLDYALHQVRDFTCDLDYWPSEFLFVACFLPVLCYFDAGRALLKDNPKLIDDFLDLSGKVHHLSGIHLSSFMNNVTELKSDNAPLWFDGFGVTDADVPVRLNCDGYTYGLLTIGKQVLTFISGTSKNGFRRIILQVPDWVWGVHDDEEYCYTDDAYVDDRTLIYNIMARAIVTLGGFRADYVSMYPVNSIKNKFTKLKYNLPNVADCWQQVEKFISDFTE